jgi:hypothetical protein
MPSVTSTQNATEKSLLLRCDKPTRPIVSKESSDRIAVGFARIRVFIQNDRNTGI